MKRRAPWPSGKSGWRENRGRSYSCSSPLNFLAKNVVLTGDIRTAAALVEEERLLSIMTRVAPVGYGNVLLAAFRGDAANAIPMIGAMIATATRDGQGRIIAFSHYVSAVLYNGLGRHAEALDCARRVVEWDALGDQTLAAAELAEAASREGDTVGLAEISAWVRGACRCDSHRMGARDRGSRPSARRLWCRCRCVSIENRSNTWPRRRCGWNWRGPTFSMVNGCVAEAAEVKLAISWPSPMTR